MTVFFRDGSDSPLVRVIPPVVRARGFRLYTLDGRRLVDLWQYGGRALLGHTPSKLLLALKNSAQRGLFSPLPHPQAARLEKALAGLFPSRLIRVYRDDASLERTIAANAATAGLTKAGAVSLWRPFVTVEEPFAVPDAPVLFPVIPLPWRGAPAFLVLKEEAAPAFPPSDIISPVILSAAARAVYDLVREAKNRVLLPFKKLDKNLAGLPWERQGIYLSYTGAVNAETYQALFSRFLEGGFVLPPDPGLPAILPPGLSPGETAKLFSLLPFRP